MSDFHTYSLCNFKDANYVILFHKARDRILKVRFYPLIIIIFYIDIYEILILLP